MVLNVPIVLLPTGFEGCGDIRQPRPTAGFGHGHFKQLAEENN